MGLCGPSFSLVNGYPAPVSGCLREGTKWFRPAGVLFRRRRREETRSAFRGDAPSPEVVQVGGWAGNPPGLGGRPGRAEGVYAPERAISRRLPPARQGATG